MNIVHKTYSDIEDDLRVYSTNNSNEDKNFQRMLDDLMISYEINLVNGKIILLDHSSNYKSINPRIINRAYVYTYVNRLLDEILVALQNNYEIDDNLIKILNTNKRSFNDLENIKYDKIFMIIIQKNIEYAKYYQGTNVDIIKIITRKGVKVENNRALLERIFADISEDELIVYLGALVLYDDKSTLYEIMNMIDNHIISESIVKFISYLFENNKINYDNYNKLFELVLNQDMHLMKYYQGFIPNYLIAMLENNIPFDEKIINGLQLLDSSEESIYVYLGILLLNFNKNLLPDIMNMIYDYNHPISEILVKAINDSKIKNFDYEEIFKIILSQNINYLKYYRGFNPEYLANMIINGIKFDEHYIKDLINNLNNDEFINLGWQRGSWGLKNEDLITYLGILALYKGNLNLQEIIEFITNNETVPSESIIKVLNQLYLENQCCNEYYDSMFKIFLNKNEDYIKYYIGTNLDYLKIMVDKNIKIGELLKRNIIHELQTNNKLSNEDELVYSKILGINNFDYNALKVFKGDPILLIESFNKIEEFLKILNINRETFIQYSFGTNINWLEIILKIYNSENMNDFVQIKNLFFENYYHCEHSNGIIEIKNLLDLLKNYDRYPKLCKNLLNENLNEKDISNLKILFDVSTIINSINEKNDLANIENIIFENYVKEFNKIKESDNLEEIKNIICMLLFNMNFKEVSMKLNSYGNIKDLRQLLFNNRKNKKIAEDILDMMVYVSIMEDIVDCIDVSMMKEMIEKILTDKNNDIYINCQRCNMVFRDFDKKMTSLYAKEMNANLTDLENLPEELIDKNLSQKYGIEVIDLSDYKYCILEHAKSMRESVESLVYGNASGNQIAICLSLGSHRNQRLYRNAKDSIIFGCCNLPESLFIKSSIANMGSNRMVGKYDSNVSTQIANFTQRGALETSSAPKGYNSEILCYRDGLKFQYIILPGGREPTFEEIRIAKQYHLKFVKVQELNKSIDNPKEISNINDNKDNHQVMQNHKEDNLELTSLHDIISERTSNILKKVAIFTDAHGLFEPTLAILEDARRSGISEIYSLGDNIGTGPNPKEVMDLLQLYGVKSLRGNHEIYAAFGVDSLREHLDKTGSYISALKNSTWTKTQLTEAQIEQIKSMPDNMIIEVGGEKVMLSHYIKDYNTDKEIAIPSDVSQIFQGHVHFEANKGNLVTLRGAGIGNRSDIPSTASYVILTEKETGGYEVEYRTIKYDLKSSIFDIIESDMDSLDKEKIERWVGGKSK